MITEIINLLKKLHEQDFKKFPKSVQRMKNDRKGLPTFLTDDSAAATRVSEIAAVCS